MDVSHTMETEEDLLTCLSIKFYHPQQSLRGLYSLLPTGIRIRRSADDPLRLGRDPQSCCFALVDPRVSRKQLGLYAYRTAQSPNMLFTIQNLSQRGCMSVNGSALGYLERTDLPEKALVRFGEYEMLIIQEPGEAKGSYEVEFEVLPVPPSRETGTYPPTVTPVMDTAGSCVRNGFSRLGSREPSETDETLPYDS
ncbi:TRAF-interacting protein with FHA domain-containing protein A [Thalassophryne amazonica]|uniref:TRAF-interacting protein with FHA domain-containing protein A n=1 Tax=Thalassophryne amazonica TaxID=390379 RepID=UPI001470CFE7|nr:TRAF-interacting protein with FHA domain-containing protein A [Thalassophryne amazonica]